MLAKIEPPPVGPLSTWPADPWKMGQLLMHQQCWCWGQDIRSVAGNVLLSNGFQRSRPPDRSLGSTRYALRLPTAALWLWGFGVVYEDRAYGAIYLNRYSFRPAYSERPFRENDMWNPQQVADSFTPSPLSARDAAAVLTGSLLLWIASYEEGILQCAGLSYRRATLLNWHEPAILPECVPAEWKALARSVEWIVDPDRTSSAR